MSIHVFSTSFSAFYDHEFGACQALSLCNFEHHVDCPKFWMSRMCRFYNTITPYSFYPSGFSSIIASTIVLFSLLSQNACLQIFIAECSFPCVVMAIWMTSKYKHRLNKDWCHSYMSYCLSANSTWQYDCTFFCLQICCSSVSCFTHYENCATPIKQAQDDTAM